MMRRDDETVPVLIVKGSEIVKKFYSLLCLQCQNPFSFVVSDSGVVNRGAGTGLNQFQRIIAIARNVASELKIGSGGHRAAILEYSSVARLRKWPRYFFEHISVSICIFSKTALQEVINQLPYVQGSTDTGSAIGVVLDEFVSSRRNGVPLVIFTISDGYHRTKCISGCQLDVVLLMDFSGGAKDKRDAYIELASSLIKNLHLGPFDVQVAMIRYSGPGRADTVFHLNKHTNANDAVLEMAKAPHMGGTTRTGEAIKFAMSEFDEKNGGRKNAKKIIVLFTDGYSQEDPAEAAQLARRSGIEMNAVAVEDELVPPDTDQLVAIATESVQIIETRHF
ncbi:unnamed protein product [Toxocara canis]|uniref:VWFA domain-containing protein n=1 Tax=Toxocara canis TaxID=6265 RepID=A0A183UUZ4_TOXCA|nr:unnamed protein product [Toxocara canis]